MGENKLYLTDIDPDGVRVVVDWSKFTPGSSIFIPCINTTKAVRQIIDVCKLQKEDLVTRVKIENTIYGVRIWRKT